MPARNSSVPMARAEPSALCRRPVPSRSAPASAKAPNRLPRFRPEKAVRPAQPARAWRHPPLQGRPETGGRHAVKRLAASPALVIVPLLIPSAARAQKIQLFGGSSYLRQDTPAGTANRHGGERSGTLKGAWLGFTADFSGHCGTPFGPSRSLQRCRFGPQLSLPPPVFSARVHARVGGARESSGGFSDTALAAASTPISLPFSVTACSRSMIGPRASAAAGRTSGG